MPRFKKKTALSLIALAALALILLVKDLPGQAELGRLTSGLHFILDKDLNVIDYLPTVAVSLDDLPQHLRQAVTAASPPGAGTPARQLAKSLLPNQDRSWTRKLRERLIGLQLEIGHTQDEILAMYLNTLYFGNGAYGVEAAARKYFNKRATQVNLYEAAVLAAALKSPNRINPIDAPELSHERARLVLEQMVKYGFIGQEQLEPALRAGIRRGDQPFWKIEYRYFRDWILPMVAKRIGTPQGSIRVITTLNPELQLYGERAVRRSLSQFSRHRVSQGALVAMSPDGAVRAMVGGARYGVGHDRSTFNRVTQAKRQLGSVFKPVVFLEALRQGYAPATPILDAPLRRSDATGDWPRNYERRYRGRVTLEQALVHSLNAATVRLMDALGPQRVAELGGRLGIRSRLEADVGLALGIGEASLLEIATVFAVFANLGEEVAPYGIVGILDERGRILYWRKQPKLLRLVKPRHLAALNQMLQAAVRRGTGRQAAFGRHPAAGKTGTTQNYRDAWFLGYTAHLVAGVWVGNDDQTPMRSVSGGELPALIWRSFMANAHRGLPARPL